MKGEHWEAHEGEVAEPLWRGSPHCSVVTTPSHPNTRVAQVPPSGPTATAHGLGGQRRVHRTVPGGGGLAPSRAHCGPGGDMTLSHPLSHLFPKTGAPTMRQVCALCPGMVVSSRTQPSQLEGR